MSDAEVRQGAIHAGVILLAGVYAVSTANLFAAIGWAIEGALIATHTYYIYAGNAYFEYFEIVGFYHLLLIALVFTCGFVYAISISNLLAIVAWGGGVASVAVRMYHSRSGDTYLEYFSQES